MKVLGEFKCPVCGSCAWGSSNMGADFSKWIGHCHGVVGDEKNGYRSCSFSWPRQEDEKYFDVVVRSNFR
jgi:hypothetical protein